MTLQNKERGEVLGVDAWVIESFDEKLNTTYVIEVSVRQQNTVEPLEANPGLADLGPIYSAGLKIELPSLPDAEVTNDVIKLWD